MRYFELFSNNVCQFNLQLVEQFGKSKWKSVHSVHFNPCMSHLQWHCPEASHPSVSTPFGLQLQLSWRLRDLVAVAEKKIKIRITGVFILSTNKSVTYSALSSTLFMPVSTIIKVKSNFCKCLSSVESGKWGKSIRLGMAIN